MCVPDPEVAVEYKSAHGAACLSWQDGCVHSPTESAAVQSFVDAVSIWRLTDGAVGDIIDAATDCLVEGIGTRACPSSPASRHESPDSSSSR
jgi:hypothetical protein